MASEAGSLEEALERWTRRIHCRRLCGSPGAMRLCLPESLFGFACVGHRGTEGCHSGRLFHKRDRVGGWHRRTVLASGHSESGVVVCQV